MQALTALDPAAVRLLKRHNLWAQLVRAEVVAAAVADEEVTTDEREQAIAQQLRYYGLSKPEELEPHLQAQGVDLDAWRWLLLLPFRTRSYALHQFRPKAEARFLERKERLDRVVYSLLRVKDAGLAQELYLRISGKEADFADLAQSFSEGPESTTRGIVGPVPLNQAHPALAERLRTSSPGTLLAPFRIEDWWLVARLESYSPARFDEVVAEQMAAELFEEWVQQETTAIVDRSSVPSETSGLSTPPA